MSYTELSIEERATIQVGHFKISASGKLLECWDVALPRSAVSRAATAPPATGYAAYSAQVYSKGSMIPTFKTGL